MDESMSEGHERKEKGHAEKERRNDGFGAGDVFCNHLNKAPVHNITWRRSSRGSRTGKVCRGPRRKLSVTLPVVARREKEENASPGRP